MTLTTTNMRIQYAGTGSTGPYPYPFRILDATHLALTRSGGGVDTALSYPADFAVSGVGNATGGSVTLTTALATGETLTIRRDVPLTQETSLRNQGTYYPATVENRFDQQTMVDQQQQDALDRALRLPATYDPAGRPLELVPTAGRVVVGDGTGFTTATLDASATALPGAGRTVATLSAYLANNAVYNIRDYGASPSASAAINTTAINAAAAAAGTAGLLYGPAGDYQTNGTITVLGPALFESGCRVYYTGTGDALHVGDGAALVQNRMLQLPEVWSVSKPATGWTGAGAVGILLRKVYDCPITIPYVDGFLIGVKFYGVAGDGCDYNLVRISYLRNNKVNLQLDAAANAGWVNENVFLGGRLSHNPAEGTTVANTRHVQILGGTGTVDILNNNRFWGMSLEGAVDEYKVECRGLHNYFLHCRWETSGTPRVWFNGANAIYNRIIGGYDANRIAVTESGGAINNGVESSNGVRLSASPADAIYVLRNGDSSATPIVMGLPATGNPFSPGAGWCFTLSAFALKGKQSGDSAASPRVVVDFNSGAVTAQSLQVAGSSAATTPGSVVKKLPIYDTAGTLLGYLPIYGTIT
jgi:hypothetical protein